jgi:putative endonuclease
MSRSSSYYVCILVYILASHSRVLYVGSTSDPARRMYQHVQGVFPGFTRTYRVTRLVWWDATPNSRGAVAREREIKSWRREKKVRLIEGSNPEWLDLAVDWFTGTDGQDPSLRSG